MKVTIMGSGTMVPSNTRNSSGVLVEFENTRSMIDFGYGTMHNLLKKGLTYHDIDRIYFTHNHPDHICDLVPFLFASRYPNDPRRKDLEIVAGPGFKQFFDTLMQAYKSWLIPSTYKVKILEQDEETKLYDGLIVTSKKVRHIELSRGYRFEFVGGKSLVVSGDTDYCESMIELGKKADLMILECSTPDDMKIDGHLTPSECGRLAQKANCRKLCLTHFYPVCDQKDVRAKCLAEFSGE
ncbi:uncharacterized protein METZ01_LOCUS243578, partial [marine metagenome]